MHDQHAHRLRRGRRLLVFLLPWLAAAVLLLLPLGQARAATLPALVQPPPASTCLTVVSITLATMDSNDAQATAFIRNDCAHAATLGTVEFGGYLSCAGQSQVTNVIATTHFSILYPGQTRAFAAPVSAFCVICDESLQPVSWPPFEAQADVFASASDSVTGSQVETEDAVLSEPPAVFANDAYRGGCGMGIA